MTSEEFDGLAFRMLSTVLDAYGPGNRLTLGRRVGFDKESHELFRADSVYMLAEETKQVELASAVQTVIFSKEKWTATEAKTWLSEHDFKNSDMDETENSYRFRQFPPGECDPDSYQSLTENLPAGVTLVVCDRKESNESKSCSCQEEKKEIARAEPLAVGEAAAEEKSAPARIPAAAGSAETDVSIEDLILCFTSEAVSGDNLASAGQGDPPPDGGLDNYPEAAPDSLAALMAAIDAAAPSA